MRAILAEPGAPRRWVAARERWGEAGAWPGRKRWCGPHVSSSTALADCLPPGIQLQRGWNGERGPASAERGGGEEGVVTCSDGLLGDQAGFKRIALPPDGGDQNILFNDPMEAGG